jgi:hypothetical protein
MAEPRKRTTKWPDKPDKPNKADREKARALEHGDIFFFYHPKATVETVRGPGDVAGLHMILHPVNENLYRYAALDLKGLYSGQRPTSWWATLEAVEERVEAIRHKLLETHPLPPARPCGEGVYTIARHADHTHLAYALELPETPGEVLGALGIVQRKANPFLAVLNPLHMEGAAEASPEIVLPEYPPDLLAQFGDERLHAADPVKLLNYEGAEFLVAAINGNDPGDLGLDLMPERETEATSEVLDLLRIRPGDTPMRPLFEGHWA